MVFCFCSVGNIRLGNKYKSIKTGFMILADIQKVIKFQAGDDFFPDAKITIEKML